VSLLHSRGRHRPKAETYPLVPDGWHFIAPADAVPGDGALLPDGSIQRIGIRRFDDIAVEVRRQSWAVRLAEQPTYPLPLVETWYACSQWYTPPSTWQQLLRWLRA
jgi:hypothetical protein